ncbi:MAG: MotA/TolQ/ExbB proton channel family protein [Helicobacteraceae bacterium]|jgi:biopolymer transport protein ExbB|nr:MotA/TolQ/ExbB proton channel family protein [Helicobacteraceae bacterium]
MIGIYLEGFFDYMGSGGFVMWPLFFVAMFLWFGLGFRFHTLKRGSEKSVRTLIRKYHENKRVKVVGIIDSAIQDGMEIVQAYGRTKTARKLIDDNFYDYETEIKKYSKMVMTLVAIAPLIGLLGTVVGMIETFDSLATASLFSQTGGIAGGISQALFTTQLGLVVAVPGVIIGRLLDRRSHVMELELEQIKDILCTEDVKEDHEV